jgi:osmoprotectant transport system ATP-binding protein
VIRLAGVTKRFPGQPAPAVDGLTLEIEAGRTCVLIGPSGSGKTTTLRMINRLVEPTSGRIEVNGVDVARLDPVRLRRSMGYVIQHVGLFPHLTVAENVATVPRLLRWPAPRVRERVDAMLELVGLEPALYRGRFPRELSGGQRQRAGVARALAADPPVMLMDEPFGAIDPITRGRLQDELLGILRTIGKTVVLVTHDVDEAMKMGDRVAILRDGRLVQYAPPAEILTRPADDFVEAFVGRDRALKRLTLLPVADVMTAGVPPAADADGAVVAREASATEALSLMLASGRTRLAVVDAAGRPVGVVTLDAIRRAAAAPPRTAGGEAAVAGA